MAIKRLQKRAPSFPNIGKLRKGAPKPEKGPGRDLAYFRFDTTDRHAQKLFEAMYGSEPTEIEVFLPFTTTDENFPCWQEEYVAGGLKHRCDGETCVLWYDDKSGQYKNDPKPCPGGCKEVGRLQVIIPALQRFAYVTAETHSIHDIMRLTEQLQASEAMRGDLRSIPFVLRRTPVEISTPKPNTNKRSRRVSHLLSIEPSPQWAALQLAGMSESALALPEDRLALPEPELPLLEDSETTVVVDEPHGDPTESTRKEFHATMGDVFGDNANAARPWLIKRFTSATTPENIRESSKDLSGDEMRAVIDALKSKSDYYAEEFEKHLDELYESENQE